MKTAIRKDDMVRVVAGENKGDVAKVLRVLRDEGKVVVEGVNKVYKHVRPSQRNPKGGRLSMEMPIDLSNVQLYSEERGQSGRIGFRVDENGVKHRVIRLKGGETVDVPPRA